MEYDKIKFDRFWEMVQRHVGLVVAPNAYNLTFFAYTYDPRSESVEFVSNLKKWSTPKTLTRKDFVIAWAKYEVKAESEEEGVMKAIIRYYIKWT